MLSYGHIFAHAYEALAGFGIVDPRTRCPPSLIQQQNSSKSFRPHNDRVEAIGRANHDRPVGSAFPSRTAEPRLPLVPAGPAPITAISTPRDAVDQDLVDFLLAVCVAFFGLRDANAYQALLARPGNSLIES